MIAPSATESSGADFGQKDHARDGRDRRPRLAICTALTAAPGRRAGSLVLTRKFLDGVSEYLKYWPGSITVWVQRVERTDSNLDHLEVLPDELPFGLRALGGDESDPARFDPAIQSADLVLAALVDRHVVLANACRRPGVPLAYVTEYSVKTRQQIIRAEARNPLLRWRAQRITTRLERDFEQAVKLGAGVQCNGTPTFDAYRALNNHALLYFDTRVRAAQLAPMTTVDSRVTEMRRGKPLRLAFSGRLIAMKGADHLPRVARELARLNVPFTMDICGGGALEPRIRDDVARFSLGDRVRLRGVLDFERELLPFVSSEVDLFVCCHRQGDPSCTYLETYSCGVPIVGYDNEALAGLVRTSGVGGPDWIAPLDDPITLARRIADLDSRRDDIAAASHNAVAFAAQHTFEHTMRNRVQHMLDCLRDHDQMRANVARYSKSASA